MVCGTDIRLKEQVARIFEGPVIGNCVFLFRILLNGFDDCFKGAMFTYQLQSGVGADFRDRIDIVTAEKNTKIDKLDGSEEELLEKISVIKYLLHLHSKSFQNTIKVYLLNRLFALLTECKMSQQDR